MFLVHLRDTVGTYKGAMVAELLGGAREGFLENLLLGLSETWQMSRA